MNSWVNAFGTGAGLRDLKFKKVKNTVFIQGTISNTGSIIQSIFTLPTGYRPTDLLASACCENGSVSNFYQFIVDTAGVVQIAGAAATNKTLNVSIVFNVGT